jgi:hypothetical protein
MHRTLAQKLTGLEIHHRDGVFIKATRGYDRSATVGHRNDVEEKIVGLYVLSGRS